MPKYSFTCGCGSKRQTIVAAHQNEIPCKVCGSSMKRELPIIGGQEVRELVDETTGVSWTEDQEQLLRERKEDYYWRVEVPRLVQKYSLETSLEQGWVYIDDRGEVQLHTKPPSKR